MDKEAVNRLSKFKLRDKEKGGIVLEIGDISQCKEEYKLNLFGKIWGMKSVNYSKLRNTFSQLWCQKRELKMVELGHNFYQFISGRNEEMDNVA